MKSRPTIVVAGMCNTKGTELRFVAEQVAEHGGEPLVMDLSLGGGVDWADIPLAEVLAATGTAPEAVYAAPRAAAIDLVGHAGAAKILQLHAEGRCDGIISWAGAVGTTTATMVMRALPFGVPKVMLSDMVASDISRWIGTKDIWMVNPTAEQGVNIVTRRAVANAAAAVVAMARLPELPTGDRPLCAITAYGSTTPTVARCSAYMEARGWDVAIFHAVGVPGATMEDLVREGEIRAVIDLTIAELMGGHLGSVYRAPDSWEGERLTAAGELGVPQVVVPGGLDQASHGALEVVPQWILDAIADGRRPGHHGTRSPYLHNANVTIILPTSEETAEVAGLVAARLGRATGPTAFVVPLRGLSAYDQPEATATRERGWAEGNGDGPTWEPDPEVPAWSRKAAITWRTVAAATDPANEHLDVLAADLHVLDPEFADLLTRIMGDMLDGTWRKGAYRDLPGIVG